MAGFSLACCAALPVSRGSPMLVPPPKKKMAQESEQLAEQSVFPLRHP